MNVGGEVWEHFENVFFSFKAENKWILPFWTVTAHNDTATPGDRIAFYLKKQS